MTIEGIRGIEPRASRRRRHEAYGERNAGGAARCAANISTNTEIVVASEATAARQVHLVVSRPAAARRIGAINGAALVYHDITASRETEHKLQQSQKLDAIGKLTGGVAHDFNNMLTVITGTTETLVAALRDQPALLKTAELIDQAAERCSELIQHLLAFARRQPLQPRNVDINSTVLDIAKLLRPTLGEQIEIDSMLEQEVATAHIDASQLANSLLNMAINARDAMPNGGKLLLETGNVVLDEAYAAANPDVRPGPYVMIAVSDTGTGMSKEVQDKVFEPFFTTKEVGKGTGPRPEHGLRLRQAVGRPHQDLQRGRPRHHDQALSAARARPGRGEGGGRRAASPAAPRPLWWWKTTAGAQLRHRAAAEPGLPDRRRRRRPRGACAGRQGRAVRPLFTDVIMPGGISGRQLAEEVAEASGRAPGCSTPRAIPTTRSCITAASTRACCC